MFGWRRKAAGEKSGAPERAPLPDWAKLFAEHQTSLAGIPAPQRRGQILMIWRQHIDVSAHDYADLVLASSGLRPAVIEAEVNIIMRVYFQGYMAGRGWASPDHALAASFHAGRELRDRLRTIGIAVDGLCATLGTTVDQALREITASGIADGAEAKSPPN